jgi:peptide/nickel transport system substrate-binding protein
LREAGQEHLTFTYRLNNDNGTATQMAAIFQQQLHEIGVTMEIQGNEFATFFADVLKGEFQMYSLRWIGANNDPDMFNLVFHSKSVPPNGANRGHYSNSRIDQLIEFARREVNIEKRKQAYAEIQRIVAEELPYISLFYTDVVCVSSPRIEGIKLFPTGNYDFLTNIRSLQTASSCAAVWFRDPSSDGLKTDDLAQAARTLRGSDFDWAIRAGDVERQFRCR